MLPRPSQVLSAAPEVTSTEEAELALREISWCAGVAAEQKAETERKLAQFNEDLKAAQSLDVDGRRTTLSDRRSALEAAVLKWADQHRDVLCPTNQKTAKLRNGTIRWRWAKDAVNYIEGWNHKSSVEAAGEGVFSKLTAIVERLGWHGVVEVALKISKAAAMKAVKGEQLDRDRLQSIGLKFDAGEEYLSVEVAEFVRDGR